jgi:hypothetical protein
MRTRLRMKCKACGHWNRIEVEKHFVEQHGSEPKVKVLIPLASRGNKTVFMNNLRGFHLNLLLWIHTEH